MKKAMAALILFLMETLFGGVFSLAAGDAHQGLGHLAGETLVALAQHKADLIEIQVFCALFVNKGSTFAGDKLGLRRPLDGSEKVMAMHHIVSFSSV